MCFGSAVEMSRLMSETEEIHDCIIAGIDTVAADFEHPAGDASWLIAALLAECGQRYRIDPAQTTLYGSAAAGGYALRALLADGDTWRNAIVCNPDRKSVVQGKSVSVSVDIGGCRILQKKKKK